MLRASGGHRANTLTYERPVEPGLRPRRAARDGGQGRFSGTRGRGRMVGVVRTRRSSAGGAGKQRWRAAGTGRVDPDAGAGTGARVRQRLKIFGGSVDLADLSHTRAAPDNIPDDIIVVDNWLREVNLSGAMHLIA